PYDRQSTRSRTFSCGESYATGILSMPVEHSSTGQHTRQPLCQLLELIQPRRLVRFLQHPLVNCQGRPPPHRHTGFCAYPGASCVSRSSEQTPILFLTWSSLIIKADPH